MEKKGVYKNSVSSAPALKTPPVPVIFPDLSRKIGLRCRALLEDRIFVIDVRINLVLPPTPSILFFLTGLWVAYYPALPFSGRM